MRILPPLNSERLVIPVLFGTNNVNVSINPRFGHNLDLELRNETCQSLSDHQSSLLSSGQVVEVDDDDDRGSALRRIYKFCPVEEEI